MDNIQRDGISLKKEYMSKILIVDDEKNVAELIKYNLEIAGYETTMVHDGKSAVDTVKTGEYDLVILDIMLPEIDGFSILRYIRSCEGIADIPVIMLTAKASESDIVLGLEIGADDYMVKPFKINELVARVKVQLRKNEKTLFEKEETTELGSIVVDNASYKVTKNGQEIPLTNKEYELFRYLVSRQGKVCTRENILSQIWGYEYIGGTRTVDVHIRSLRKKLFQDENEYRITTIIGVGYKFEKSIN
jgi:two-component system alkaline phosphatase synthesis response regulator PhoP